MSKDALQNGGAVLERPEMGSFQPVSGMQTKLHFWGGGRSGPPVRGLLISCATRRH
jgi:hypothetical protein